MRESYPVTDRLVLLGRSLQHMDRGGELAEVTKVLGPRDRNNLDLQLALAFAYDQREHYDQAEAEYRPAAQGAGRRQNPRGAARGVDGGRGPLRGPRRPAGVGRRSAIASCWPAILTIPPIAMSSPASCSNGGRLDEAAELYEGHNPDYEGRMLLVMIRIQAKNAAAAEREARRCSRTIPATPRPKGLLADVLNLRGDYRQARSIYERLLKSNAVRSEARRSSSLTRRSGPKTTRKRCNASRLSPIRGRWRTRTRCGSSLTCRAPTSTRRPTPRTFRRSAGRPCCTSPSKLWRRRTTTPPTWRSWARCCTASARVRSKLGGVATGLGPRPERRGDATATGQRADGERQGGRGA